MSYSSSTVNTIFTGSGVTWFEGQPPVGTITTGTLPSQNVTSETPISITQNLGPGIWSVTPNYTTTSNIDGSVFVRVLIGIQTNGAAADYLQAFYYDATIDDAGTLSNYINAIIPVTAAASPLTVTYALEYNTAATDPTVVGSFTFIRIA
jgi:hypothetical protein